MNHHRPSPVYSAWRTRLIAAAGTVIIVLAAHVALSDDNAAPAPPPKVADHQRHVPGVVPDRVILTFAGDPATSQAVTWRTDRSVKTPQAQIAVATVDKKFSSKPKMIPGKTELLKTEHNEAACHSVVFEGLSPATLYAYRVGDGANWSEWFHFRTAEAEAKPFKFIYFGDAQNDIRSLWSRVIREAYRTAPDASFLLHAGDLINSANVDAEWGDWFAAGGWVNGSLPSIATPGNHEYFSEKQEGKKERIRRVSRHWRPSFTLPENGPPGLEETVYYVDYQGVRFISLNSNEKQKEQADWLKGVLSNNPNRWTILTFHHPIFSTGKGRDNKALREAWKPVFDQFDVDLVLQGHDHTYGRSGLIHGENVAEGTQLNDAENGTVYVVSVSGPKMYSLNDEKWRKKSATNTQLYQVIQVENGKLRYEAYTALGKLYDVFELHKSEDGHKRIVEWEALKAEEEAGGLMGAVGSSSLLAVGLLLTLGGLVWVSHRRRGNLNNKGKD